MSETKKITSTFGTDKHPHTELEAHRKQAEEHFGGHVHVVTQHSSSVPRMNDDGLVAEHITVLTSIWRKAPDEPAPPASQTESFPPAED